MDGVNCLNIMRVFLNFSNLCLCGQLVKASLIGAQDWEPREIKMGSDLRREGSNELKIES